MAAALGRDDLAAAGRLMDDSHASLRDLYEVSSPELDLITELAREHPACLGARLTGAGFGGCAVALVRSAGAADFVSTLEGAWRSRRPELTGAIFAARPSAGAHLDLAHLSRRARYAGVSPLAIPAGAQAGAQAQAPEARRGRRGQEPAHPLATELRPEARVGGLLAAAAG